MFNRSCVPLLGLVCLLGLHCANGSSTNNGVSSGENSGGPIGSTSGGGSGAANVGSPGSSGGSSSGSSSGPGSSSSGATGQRDSGAPNHPSGSGSSGSGGVDSGPSNAPSSGGSPDASSSGSSGSSSSGSSGGAEGGTSSGPGSYTCFPAGSGTDFTSDGPLMATSNDNASVQCTIFPPTVLGSRGCLNPVIVWGNGTVNTPSSYQALFNHLATHGFIIAAADTSNAGSGMEMLACLNYIIGQNTMSGSPLAGHVDVNNIASAGYSQGGAGALAAGEDPRFTNVLAVSPYVVISLGSYDPSGYAAAQIHPLFMISGGADTVAVPSNNQQPIYDTAPVPIFWATHAGSSHLEVLGAGGAYAGPMTAWFRWKLMGDPDAAKWFEKPTCTLCNDPSWMVQTNSKWQ